MYLRYKSSSGRQPIELLPAALQSHQPLVKHLQVQLPPQVGGTSPPWSAPRTHRMHTAHTLLTHTHTHTHTHTLTHTLTHQFADTKTDVSDLLSSLSSRDWLWPPKCAAFQSLDSGVP